VATFKRTASGLGEIKARKDVYGYDALGRALPANDRPAEADTR
jgi:hypothetical protein